MNDPAWVFASVRSETGAAAIVVRSLAPSFAVLVSPPPDTDAVLVTDAAALAETLTVNVIAG